jgi:hypothetical protein
MEDLFEKPGSGWLAVGLAAIGLSFLWWASSFGGSSHFIGCWWFWGLECSFASGIVTLGGGKPPSYSPIVFWFGAICTGVGAFLMSRDAGPTQASRLTYYDIQRNAAAKPPEKIVLGDVDTSKVGTFFTDVLKEISRPAFDVLQQARHDGYSVRLERSGQVDLLKDSEWETFVSNEQILAFGEKKGWAIGNPEAPKSGAPRAEEQTMDSRPFSDPVKDLNATTRAIVLAAQRSGFQVSITQNGKALSFSKDGFGTSTCYSNSDVVRFSQFSHLT